MCCAFPLYEPEADGGLAAYPERLVVYPAGTGRTVFLGWVKIATIFTFAFFGLVVSPRYLLAAEPLWAAACACPLPPPLLLLSN